MIKWMVFSFFCSDNIICEKCKTYKYMIYNKKIRNLRDIQCIMVIFVSKTIDRAAK